MHSAVSLPENYPIADASWEEKEAWLDAPIPPYGRVREAAPWLNTDMQVDWYLDGLRAAMANPEGSANVVRLLRLDRIEAWR